MKTTVLHRQSELTGHMNQMEVLLTPAELTTGLVKLAWGVPPEEAFPTLTRVELQFVQTGITPEEEDAHYASLGNHTVGVN